jgi:hypothetical protein
MRKYCLTLRDDEAALEIEINAASDQQAVELAKASVQQSADDWCRGAGCWGDNGATIEVGWHLADEEGNEVAEGEVTVEIEIDHAAMISSGVPRWDRPANWCGNDPEDHDWTRAGEGGCESNPGVWSSGGTSMTFDSHCRRCGLHRTEHHVGSQRNPGKHDSVEYSMLADEEIKSMRDRGHMDQDD